MARIADIKNPKKRTKSVLLDETAFTIFKNRREFNPKWNFSDYVNSCLKRDFPDHIDMEKVLLSNLLECQRRARIDELAHSERIKEAALALSEFQSSKEFNVDPVVDVFEES